MNEETVEQTQGIAGQGTSVPSVERDLQSASNTTIVKETNESNKENVLKESTDKAISETATNKPATTSKNKTSRDKNGGGVTGSRVTSKSHISGSESGGNSVGTSRKPTPNSQASLAGNYILEPDPKVKIALKMSYLLCIRKLINGMLAPNSSRLKFFLSVYFIPQLICSREQQIVGENTDDFLNE